MRSQSDRIPFSFFEMISMQTKLSRIAAPVLLTVTLALGACKQGDKPEDALAQDTSLAHDLSLANADTMAQPQLKDVPATTVPAVSPSQAAPKIVQRQTTTRTPRRVVPVTRPKP